MRIYEIDHLAAELSVICSTNLTPGLLLTPLVVQFSNLTYRFAIIESSRKERTENK